jgi:uncharacterized membrane protein YecN with MAPEG domain
MKVPVALTAMILLGAGFIVVVCGLVIAVGVCNSNWLPRACGWLLMAMYGVYLLVALVMVFSGRDDTE